MCWGISERGGVDGDDEESRAAHSSQKCLDCGGRALGCLAHRLRTTQPRDFVHVAMCAALKSTYCTMYGYRTFWGDDAILVDLID